MYTDADLDSAVAAGALNADAATAFRAHVAAVREPQAADEEQFRLLTGFNDIFVTIAAVLLLVAVGWIGAELEILGSDRSSPLAGAFVAIVSWSLAEFFTLRRRMALPSIVLLLAFVGGSFAAVMAILAGIIDASSATMGAIATAIAAAVAAGAAAMHWRRFHVPITIAAGAAALAALLVSLVIGLLGASGGIEDVATLATLFAAGLAIFAFAMWWDVSDPRRRTRRSDVAFWLHLLAAPMIVHPIFWMLGLLGGGATPAQALLVIALYIAMGAVALAIDRRALLVSALAYVLYALSLLFREFGAVSLSVALTALVIGSALLLLSAFWQNARAIVLRWLPDHWTARLPPVVLTRRTL